MTETALTVQSPAAMIAMAIQQGTDLTQLERLLDLQIKYEQNEAKKAYHQAMADFKADPPEIFKNKHVAFDTAKGKTEYDHATLANVTTQINTSLSKHGLSATWTTNQDEKGKICVTCKVTHAMGHSESTTLCAESDTSGGKNAIQGIGSTVSYLERYTVLAITGLATTDMDDENQMKPEVEYITPDQVIEIDDLITETESSLEKFLKVMKADCVEHILAINYQTAVNALNKKKGMK